MINTDRPLFSLPDPVWMSSWTRTCEQNHWMSSVFCHQSSFFRQPFNMAFHYLNWLNNESSISDSNIEHALCIFQIATAKYILLLNMAKYISSEGIFKHGPCVNSCQDMVDSSFVLFNMPTQNVLPLWTSWISSKY